MGRRAARKRGFLVPHVPYKSSLFFERPAYSSVRTDERTEGPSPSAEKLGTTRKSTQRSSVRAPGSILMVRNTRRSRALVCRWAGIGLMPWHAIGRLEVVKLVNRAPENRGLRARGSNTPHHLKRALENFFRAGRQFTGSLHENPPHIPPFV